MTFREKFIHLTMTSVSERYRSEMTTVLSLIPAASCSAFVIFDPGNLETDKFDSYLMNELAQ
jgi:hypothetical protein